MRHIGTLALLPIEAGKPARYRWSNKAGVSWLLHADLAHGVLKAEESSPYYHSNVAPGRAFRIQVDGKSSQEVRGFQFLNEFYQRIDAPAP